MVKFDWLQIFELGLSNIDDDHREMLALMKSVGAAASDDNFDLCSDFMDKLVDTTEAHFQREEALLEEAGYPDVNFHALVHSRLIARANEMKNTFKAINSRQNLEEGCSEMLALFLDEAIAADLHFKSFLQDKGLIKGFQRLR